MSSQSTSTAPGLNFWMLLALVVGNMIGSGIFLLPSALAHYGALSIVSWLLTTAGALCLAWVFSDLSKKIPKTGGPYAYSRSAFGEFIGFFVAYNYWIAVWVANAAVSVAFVGYLGALWPVLNEKATNFNPWFSFLVKAGFIWLLTFINILGVRRAGIMQIFMSLFKVLPLLLIGIFGLLQFHPSYLSFPTVNDHSTFLHISTAATLTFWAFLGLEAATVPAEDANRSGDVSRATLTGVLLSASLYILSTVAIMGLIPAAQLGSSQAPFSDAANILFGHHASIFIAICAMIACLGTMNAQTLLSGQIPFAAARDQLFPKTFAKRNRHNSPVAALILSAICANLLLLLTLNDHLVKQFTTIVLLSTLGYLITYFVTAMADIVLQKSVPLSETTQTNLETELAGSAAAETQTIAKSPRRRRTFIALIAGTYAFWAICGSGQQIVFFGSLLLFSSFPVYAWLKWNLKKG